MNVEQQIDLFIKMTTKKIESCLQSDKKNIVILSYYPTYRSQYGKLIETLKKDYNDISIVDRILDDDFEKQAHHNILFPWRIVENGKTYYLNADIKGIDCIITADQVGYEEGRIDRTFLSTSAKRIYLPHRLTTICGDSKTTDYIIVPSRSAMKAFKTRAKNAQLLPCGYPQFDVALENYHYKPQNTITYAPTLRYVGSRNTNINTYAGMDITLIEWLLNNTKYNISYRAHPINYSSNHLFHQLIKAKFQEQPRVIFDSKMGNDFFDYTDFLVTDWSTTTFIYSYTTLRPSFYFMPFPLDKTYKNDGDYIIDSYNSHNFKELKEKLDSIDFKAHKEFWQNLREKNIYNIGSSSEAIKEEIDKILKGKR